MRSAAVPTGTGRVPTGVVWDSSGAARVSSGAVRDSSGAARVLIGVVALAALTLTGCTPAPTTTPPSSPSAVSSPRPTPSVTPSPTPTPDAAIAPERPAAMDEVNAAGAEAVAVYFLELYPYVYATGDLDEWRALSHPDCIFCASVIANVEEQAATGSRSEGGQIHIETSESTEVTEIFFSVVVLATQQAGFEYDRGGQLVEASAGSHSEVNLVIVRNGSRWSVRAVQVEEASGT